MKKRNRLKIIYGPPHYSLMMQISNELVSVTRKYLRLFQYLEHLNTNSDFADASEKKISKQKTKAK